MRDPSLIKNACLNHRNKQNRKKRSLIIALSASNWLSYLLLWRAAWRPPLPSLRSCPLTPRWRRRSSPGPGWCPPWPGPGRSLEEPPVRRSHSACRHLAPGLLTHNWSAGSWGQEGRVGERRGGKKGILTFALVLVMCSAKRWLPWRLGNHYYVQMCRKLPPFHSKTQKCQKFKSVACYICALQCAVTDAKIKTLARFGFVLSLRENHWKKLKKM